ncbi:hypothetical protein [Kineosporia succinea]|uniref:Uncharacterized protein n=1 Tax=Kineosporia succinea TaxID=84632 RepID=A0ABT9P5U8_9ACTN|nr:hypothetical protein [Kineosporia succinea]MDP9828064.1 hypothetical protein [Kineosporia succinea]
MIDDAFSEHPKVLSIPRTSRLQVVGLWTLMGNWSARQMTDGAISRDLVVEKGGRPAQIKALIDSGLWHGPDSQCDHPDDSCPGIPGKGELIFHDWFDYQKSKQEILDRRAKREASGRAGGRASGTTRRGKSASKPEASASPKTKQVLRESFVVASTTGEPPFPHPHPHPNPSMAELVCRRLFGDARDAKTTAQELIPMWQAAAGDADLDAELRNWFIRNADTDLRSPSAALLGWLAKAAERAARPGPKPVLGCSGCDRGWLPDHPETGIPRPCPTCKPHTRRMEAV